MEEMVFHHTYVTAAENGYPSLSYTRKLSGASTRFISWMSSAKSRHSENPTIMIMEIDPGGSNNKRTVNEAELYESIQDLSDDEI